MNVCAAWSEAAEVAKEAVVADDECRPTNDLLSRGLLLTPASFSGNYLFRLQWKGSKVCRVVLWQQGSLAFSSSQQTACWSNSRVRSVVSRGGQRD